jgi:hypothetical protein
MVTNYSVSTPFATHEFQLDLFQAQIRVPPCGRSSHAYCDLNLYSSSGCAFCDRCGHFAPYPAMATTGSCCHA